MVHIRELLSHSERGSMSKGCRLKMMTTCLLATVVGMAAFSASSFGRMATPLRASSKISFGSSKSAVFSRKFHLALPSIEIISRGKKCTPSFKQGAAQRVQQRDQRHSRAAVSTNCAGVAAAPETLYDIPVSNHGARVRMLIYAKNLEDVVPVKSPQELGGIKSEEFLKLNPLGKMPILTLPDGTALPESTVILRYLDEKYSEPQHPSLNPTQIEARARSDLFAQVIDSYFTPIQGCMYRGPMDAATRAEQVKSMTTYLDVLEHLLSDKQAPFSKESVGPFCAGTTPSLGDVVAYPTLVFAAWILPKQFEWNDIFQSRPGLRRWWEAMNDWEPASRVKSEIEGALQEWDDSGRWQRVGIQEQVTLLDRFIWSYS